MEEILDIIKKLQEKYGQEISLELFEDGSGNVKNFYYTNFDEELFEFDNLNELKEEATK